MGHGLRLETSPTYFGELHACIDNLRKLPLTIFLHALGFDLDLVAMTISDSPVVWPTAHVGPNHFRESMP